MFKNFTGSILIFVVGLGLSACNEGDVKTVEGNAIAVEAPITLPNPSAPTIDLPAGDSSEIKVTRPLSPFHEGLLTQIKKRASKIIIGKNRNTLTAGLGQKCGATGDVVVDGEKVNDHCFNTSDASGTLHDGLCTEGSMVRGMVANAGKGSVEGLQFRCAQPALNGNFSNPTYSNPIGDMSGVATNAEGPKDCEVGHVAVGLHGVAGARQGMLGLVCAPWNLVEGESKMDFSSLNSRPVAGSDLGSIELYLTCPKGMTMTGAQLWVDGEGLVGAQSIYCAGVEVVWPTPPATGEPIFPVESL